MKKKVLLMRCKKVTLKNKKQHTKGKCVHFTFDYHEMKEGFMTWKLLSNYNGFLDNRSVQNKGITFCFYKVDAYKTQKH